VGLRRVVELSGALNAFGTAAVLLDWSAFERRDRGAGALVLAGATETFTPLRVSKLSKK